MIIKRERERTRGRKEIGQERVEVKSEHMHDVYEALLAVEQISNIGKKATAKNVWWELKRRTDAKNKLIEQAGWNYYNSGASNKSREEMRKEILKEQEKNETISLRTVQTCLKDPRIVKEGYNYHIADNARSETRYLRAEQFGLDMLDAAMLGLNSQGDNKDVIMTELVRRFGATILFNFIEAVRPFKDGSLTIQQRGKLIDQWAKRSVALDQMFTFFRAMFSSMFDRRTVPTTKPFNEMREEKVNELLESFKRTFPDLYENLIAERNEQPKIRDGDDKIAFIHGKTYHSGWTDWWSYLKYNNPAAFEREMQEMEGQSKSKQ